MKKKIVIKIEINDEETLQAYEDTCATIVLDDFVNNPSHWLNLPNTTTQVKLPG